MKTTDTPTVDPTTLYIVNTMDRPCERLIAEQREDGLLYYINPEMVPDWHNRGMGSGNATPLRDFGVNVRVSGDGFLVGQKLKPTSASYSDGRPREWQGSPSFEFDLQPSRDAMCPEKLTVPLDDLSALPARCPNCDRPKEYFGAEVTVIARCRALDLINEDEEWKGTLPYPMHDETPEEGSVRLVCTNCETVFPITRRLAHAIAATLVDLPVT
jgi:hypothetical protein